MSAILALAAFESVDFQWTQSLDSVWQDSAYDVPSLHRRARHGVLDKLRSMSASLDTGSPLGWVFVAPAGFGKTHLLSAVRRETLGADASFVLVDMTDVRDFWETVLLGFIDSLQKPADATGRPQGQIVVQHIVGQLQGSDGVALTSELASLRPPRLARVMDDLVQRLGRLHRSQMVRHADTLRALVLLNSDAFDLSTLGHAWLQGYGVDQHEMEKYGFNIREKRPSAVVEGLSWLLSLRGPSVVALDQLDAIVTEHHLLAAANHVAEEHSERQIVSRAIIEGVGRGLMELRDVTRRSLNVVACLTETWRNLQLTALRSTTDRYEEQRALEPLSGPEMAEQLVRARLDSGYARAGFTPPYPTWPFASPAFASTAGLSPRELLRRCEQHRRRCVDEGEVSELFRWSSTSDPTRIGEARSPAAFEALDEKLERLRATAATRPEVSEPQLEEEIGALLLAGCRLVADERTEDSDVDVSVGAESGGARGYPALHVRVRQIFRAEQDRERHLCLRALFQTSAVAFQARLTAAVIASGIDRQLAFRKLLFVRNAPVPGGAKTTELVAMARAAGAEWGPAHDDDLRALRALEHLRKDQGDELETFRQWLRVRRPASRLALMKPVADWLGLPALPIDASRAPSPSAPVVHTRTVPPSPVSMRQETGVGRYVIPIGRQVQGDRLGATQTFFAEDLRQHVVVLAGAGSGKTVLLKRLIEEVALLGIPSIVVDGANDLARLGEAWPTRPASFTEDDAEKARRYHDQTEVVVWTPGRSGGNPLHLGVLPDFAAVSHDADELDQTVAMSVDTLAGMAGKKIDGKGRGILNAALRWHAKEGGGDLAAFLDLLSDLPPEANLGISNAARIATALSDQLRAVVQTNPLLQQQGEPLDPGVLFGIGAPRTRVSVLSLMGLQGADAQLQFVNQLAMTLFTWVKKNPCPIRQPLRGLLVLDEAKDLVPSQGTTPCKDSLIRLVAQGRKYGLGVVFATQAPKSIDHNVVANASTQFYGKASSPTAIDTIQDQIRVRGGTGSDVARLTPGRFYLAGMGMAAPAKIEVPLCLSHHPPSPPDESDVLSRAVASRERLS